MHPPTARASRAAPRNIADTVHTAMKGGRCCAPWNFPDNPQPLRGKYLERFSPRFPAPPLSMRANRGPAASILPPERRTPTAFSQTGKNCVDFDSWVDILTLPARLAGDLNLGNQGGNPYGFELEEKVLPRGVTVAQVILDHFVMVRIHARQPIGHKQLSHADRLDQRPIFPLLDRPMLRMTPCPGCVPPGKSDCLVRPERFIRAC